MRVLVFFIILAGTFSLVSAITGVKGIQGANPGVTVIHETRAARVGDFAIAAGCAAMLYGIRKRARIVWLVGWLVLALGWADFIFQIVWSSGIPSGEPVWLSVGGCIGVTALGVYFAVRWYQQKDYFIRQHASTI